MRQVRSFSNFPGLWIWCWVVVELADLSTLCEGPQINLHPVLCSPVFQREGHIPSLTALLPLLGRTRSPPGMSILFPAGTFGLHLCDELTTGNRLMFDQDNTQENHVQDLHFLLICFTRWANPITHFSAFTATLPPHFTVRNARKEASTRSCDYGVLGAMGGVIWLFLSVFFLGDGWGRMVLVVPFMAFLLFASSVACFALLQCMNPSTEMSYWKDIPQ